MNDNENKRPKGRPPLTPEQKEQRRIEGNKKRNEIHKRTGYAAQQKYIEKNENEFHSIKVMIRQKYKGTLNELVAQTKMDSPAKLFLDAVEKVYGITLQDIDNDEKK